MPANAPAKPLARRFSLAPWHVGALVLVVSIVASQWQVLTGDAVYFLRDLGTTHRPAREVFDTLGFARNNPYASFGQPYLGNPNLLVAYPFPRAPRLLSFHVLAHVSICFAGTLMLLRSIGRSWDAAFIGACTFALSGYVLSARARVERRWAIVGAISLLLATAGYLPGARFIYEALPALHVLRFPIKGYLFVTLAIAVLATGALDQLKSNTLDRALRRRLLTATMLAVGAGVVLAMLIHARPSVLVRLITRLWWNQEWVGVPELVLEPIIAGMPGRLLAVVGLLLALALAIQRTSKRALTVLHVLCVLELVVVGRWLLPAIPTRALTPGPLVDAARNLRGRIFERDDRRENRRSR